MLYIMIYIFVETTAEETIEVSQISKRVLNSTPTGSTVTGTISIETTASAPVLAGKIYISFG